ncbi:hypothetical protein Q4F19_17330 [Sphingomonas sp. BIUV-7]|uniref:Glycosyltransferase RgtA/B/C/D-like domain-containing protein n=1 Tax=Sphingomonas natans TaxID=3063330 RepID=A0ABT8YCT7_9SPHN|nr:hypothetical protein [Sphingomonas sp. BIUV-7]MDO6416152.1 hypothetical protein [Sphingomonas sp. BIUV-7]
MTITSARSGLSTALYLVAIAAFFVRAALRRGPWLDEFWTFWLTDPMRPARSLMSERWILDQHPFLFSAMVRLTRGLVGGEIELQRVVVNGTGLALLISATRIFIRATPDRAAFFKIFTAILLTLPLTMEQFCDLRSYFLELVATAVWLQFAFHAATRDPERALARLPLATGCVSAFFMIALHFVTGLECLVLLGVAIVALRGRHSAELAWIAGAGAAGCLLLSASAAVQMPRWRTELDFRWIMTSQSDLLQLYKNLLLASGWAAVPALGAAILGRAGSDTATIRYQKLLMIAIVVTGGLLFLLNLIQPIAVARYMIPLFVAACSVFAAGAASDWSKSVPFRAVMIAWSVIACWVTSNEIAAHAGWYGGAREISRLVAQCPSSRVIAVNAWAYSPRPASRAASREQVIFGAGYRRAARGLGFVPEVIELPKSQILMPLLIGSCPTILWAEHMYWAAKKGSEFTAVGLSVPPDVAVTRDLATKDNLIMIVKRNQRLEAAAQ